uniref:Uncharacterized protein n=1 Tax=Vespula pensylvanica TaxID=30213 RepID=A0A834PGN4_VESPE|nr:hypothetical protein H0235_001693 [Vespula pensylvanica]
MEEGETAGMKRDNNSWTSGMVISLRLVFFLFFTAIGREAVTFLTESAARDADFRIRTSLREVDLARLCRTGTNNERRILVHHEIGLPRHFRQLSLPTNSNRNGASSSNSNSSSTITRTSNSSSSNSSSGGSMESGQSLRQEKPAKENREESEEG